MTYHTAETCLLKEQMLGDITVEDVIIKPPIPPVLLRSPPSPAQIKGLL